MSFPVRQPEFETGTDVFFEDSDSDSDSDGGVLLDPETIGITKPAVMTRYAQKLFSSPAPETLPVPSFISASKNTLSIAKKEDTTSFLTTSFDRLSTNGKNSSQYIGQTKLTVADASSATRTSSEHCKHETFLQSMLRCQAEGMSGPWETHANPASHWKNVLQRQGLGDMEAEGSTGGTSLYGGMSRSFGSSLVSKVEAVKEARPISYRGK